MGLVSSGLLLAVFIEAGAFRFAGGVLVGVGAVGLFFYAYLRVIRARLSGK